MNHSLVARLLSESLNDFYTREDPADLYEDLADLYEDPASRTQDLFEVPDSQPPYELLRLSQSRDVLDKILDSQEDPNDYNLDDDLSVGSLEAYLDYDVLPLGEVNFNNAQFSGTELNEADIYDTQFEEPACFDTKATKVVEGDTTQLIQKPNPRFVSP